LPKRAQALAKDFRANVGEATAQKLASLRVDVPFDFQDPSRPAPPVEVYDPIWVRRVNPAYVATLFPAAAAKAGLKSGRAQVECTVQHDGTLKDCVVSSEDPAGMGFGDAALTIASVMAMNPWTSQGTPVDGARIRLPLRLELPAEGPAATPTQPVTGKP
jgi:Gram-negative bacterial TonB protein C-terminal